MKKILWLAVTFSFVAFFSIDAMAGTVLSRFDVDLGGYVKLDYIHQDAALGPLSGPVPADGSSKAGQNQSLFTARQSRLHLKVTGPEFMGAKTKAFVEGDFYGPGGTNESPNFRMRHAYGALLWKDTQVLFGQYWDIFGPAVASTLDFRSGAFTGAPNNPRVPQLRVTHNVHFDDNNSLRLIFGAQNPVENFNTDSSGDMVNLAGQAMWVSKNLGVSPGYWGIPMQPLTAGFFGLYGKEKVEDNDYLDIYGYGFYAHVPLLKSKDGKSRAMTLTLETQAYVAAGLNVQGATAASTVGVTPNKDAAKGYGVFGQFIFYPTEPLGITVGYGRRNILDSSDYSDAAEVYNESYFGNVAYDLNHAVRVAAEYQRLNTKYLAIPAGATDDKGTANRFMVSAMYFF
jgi:hypothetical protein